MEKIFVVAENTGVNIEETFTIRLQITKSQLEEHCKKYSNQSYYPNINPVSFKHGLLANVHNSFKTFGVRVSEMQLSLLSDGGVVHYRANLVFGSEDKVNQCQYFLRMPEPDPDHWCLSSSYEEPAELNNSTWPDSATELKIDIKILDIRDLFFEQSNNAMPISAPGTSTGFYETISKYFLSENLSDVSIKCENATFPAHQFILSHNSPVFVKMFEHEMKESKEKCMEIKGTESNVVLEMLRFFYTGQVENLQDNGTKLYSLADIYMVDNLKLICVRSLIQCVSPENALEMYCFGKKNEIPQLVEKSKQVMVRNRKEIIKNYDDLQVLMNAVPAEMAADLFQLLW